MTITITADGSDLVCRSKYMPAALDDLKARVPYSDRTWDKENKVWRVAARHGQTLVDWARRWYGEDVTLPKVATQAVEETRILDLRYLGKAYERETGGERSATGWVDGGWNAIFPESVLHKWFMDSDDDGAAPVQGPKPTKAKNLYAVLMLQTGATRDELKKNYRRLAKQWHPDTSRSRMPRSSSWRSSTHTRYWAMIASARCTMLDLFCRRGRSSKPSRRQRRRAFTGRSRETWTRTGRGTDRRSGAGG